jgi:group I intron endonuclease
MARDYPFAYLKHDYPNPNKDKYFIYTLSDPITDTPMYVGATSDIYNRYRQHKGLSDSKTKNSKWIKSLKDNGLIPKVDVIETVNSLEWKFWEKHYISLYKSWGFELTNVTSGGLGFSNGRHSEETRKIIRAKRALQTKTRKGVPCSDEAKALIRIARLKQKDPRKGCTHTEETKQKLRDYCIQRNQGGFNKRVVLQYDKGLNFIKEWESIKDASRTLKIAQSCIHRTINGERKSGGGFVWKHKN